MSDIVIKILIIGDTSVGKTSFVNMYTEGTFTDEFLTTIGIDFKWKIIEFNETQVKIVLYDTSGQSRFRTVVTSYYKNTDAILFIYDITERATFEKFPEWLQQIKDKSSIEMDKIIIFGNKNDCAESRKVSVEEAQKLSKSLGITFVEGNVKNNVNITPVINTILSRLLEKKKAELEESVASVQEEQRISLQQEGFQKGKTNKQNERKLKQQKEMEKCC